MKKLVLIFISCFAMSAALSQPYNPAKVNKKAIALYTEAMAKAEEGNYNRSISLLQQSIAIDPKYVDAYLSIAGLYGQIKNYENSILNYEKAFGVDSAYTFEYILPYSINLAGLGQFEKALQSINILLAKKILNPNTRKAAEYRQRSYEFAVDYEKKNVLKNYVFAPQNLGDGVNTAESEYSPSLTIDGSELIFTRRVKNFNEDFYKSHKKYDTWNIAQPLEGNINTDQNEGGQMISQDGQWLVFTGCNRPDGFGNCDIYISYQTAQGWIPAVNLGRNVNSDQWDSQPCLSPDKRELYFASRRFGGYGGSDIYVCRLQPNGRWSEPENLGPQINTAGDEGSPFIHADNQTFYFTASGLQGYGDDDLFMSRRGPNGVWSNPVNLGYPINTINREGTLFVAADGKTAYFASDRSDSRGGMDIYSFELRENVRPYKTLWVKGKVFDKKTNIGLPSSVELTDVATKSLITKVQTDEQGNYLITLPVGKDYAFNVNRKGYLFYSENIGPLLTSPEGRVIKNPAGSISFIGDSAIVNIPLTVIEPNAAIVLKNVFFDINSFELKTESQAGLDKLVQLLLENPNLKIQLSGHTDNTGNAADNQKLSENRAKAVVNYLVSNGIDSKRLTAKGYGETQPVADNNSEEGKAKNRRTELKVLVS